MIIAAYFRNIFSVYRSTFDVLFLYFRKHMKALPTTMGGDAPS